MRRPVRKELAPPNEFHMPCLSTSPNAKSHKKAAAANEGRWLRLQVAAQAGKPKTDSFQSPLHGCSPSPREARAGRGTGRGAVRTEIDHRISPLPYPLPTP